MDPHLHVEFEADGRTRSAYPFLAQAYFSACRDSAVAIAGGYAYALPGDNIAVDATRSLARPGAGIASFRWRFHDRSEAAGPRASIRMTAPGMYAEELSVVTDDGREARDILHVRVWDPAAPRECAWGWVFHHPHRGIRAAVPVLFWNRAVNLREPARIDYGDGSPTEAIDREAQHVFPGHGVFTVSVSGTGARGEPFTQKMPVVVEPDAEECGRQVQGERSRS